MPKKPKKPSVADQFSDDDMNQIKHYGQMLGGGVTPFDEAVEEALNKRQAAREGEASATKMRAAQTGGSGDVGPTEMDQAAIKQRGALQQQATTAGAQAAVQAQQAQPPINAPEAQPGPQGVTTPFSAQKGAVGGPGNVTPPPAAPPPAPGGPPPDESEEQGPPQ